MIIGITHGKAIYQNSSKVHFDAKKMDSNRSHSRLDSIIIKFIEGPKKNL